jgi:ATP-dependent Lon protease
MIKAENFILYPSSFQKKGSFMQFFRKTEKAPESAPIPADPLADIRRDVEAADFPPATDAVANKELERMQHIDTSQPEYAISLNYLEFLLSLPWHRFNEDNLDLKRAEAILTSQHHGLNAVKERILEYLAVRTLCSLKDFYVLVVDDEPIARTNLEYVLKKEGCRVETAANGLEALNQMNHQEFDLILTDMKMEKMDGIQLLERAIQISPRTEIVLITGYATVNSAVDALKKGAAHYLPKPIDLEELRTLVKKIREKKRHLQMTRSPILCFTGPPGTGKTSIGRSIAEALERQFVRISLAGLRDEAELRGHRRTYVGAMCGRVLNEIRRAGVCNPVFMLDEIDKIGQDFRGDPASVLLEILDPEQNSRFVDHYLDIPFDLSAVMFITTANGIEELPPALRDRLEVIQFTGYTEKEKQRIARDYLIPRQLRANGLVHHHVSFTDQAILRLIRDYTLEAGLRNLEREIAAVCRKLARLALRDDSRNSEIDVTDTLVETFLGPRKYTHELTASGSRPGVVTGLVWTEFGGETISVEAGIMTGNQQLTLTGSLGNILRESAQTALSFIRSHAEQLSIPPDFFEHHDIHVHIPAGAIPKDGSSAGITIALALISLLTHRPSRRDIALTGELTLSGAILPVSGIREKLLAAQRAKIRTVVLPERNRVDIQALDEDVREGIEIVLADDVTRIVDVVLGPG